MAIGVAATVSQALLSNAMYPTPYHIPAFQHSNNSRTQGDIQEAIRLHESGDYERSTAMFGRLADPDGPNNPLSQVLYGLALRHGWGIGENPAEAMRYLQAAAKNSAAVEVEALRAGMKKGGTAKGELVLAMYEVSPPRPFSHLGESSRAEPIATVGQFVPTWMGRRQGPGGGARVLRDSRQSGRLGCAERSGLVLCGRIWLQEG